MKDIEGQLAELLRKAIEAAEKTGEFVIDQAPDLLKEFYAWHLTSNIMGVAISALIIYLSIRFFRFCGKKEPDKYYKTQILGRYYEADEMPFFFLAMFIGTLISIMLICFITDLFDVVKLLAAPKLYLIEYFIK